MSTTKPKLLGIQRNRECDTQPKENVYRKITKYDVNTEINKY